ncbi:MAG: hypothetical protein CML42_09845 [Rhodobacteraceae bacterium]|nr:hypothetical protein [Paracoccaceae bacterium]|tara:strand:- start:4494 stop:6581 length:2088 start_codon:yes stop_codon:yes gene_type:complete
MVQSKINTDVSYKEKNDIHKKDDEMEAFLYSYPILGFDCTICLGNINYDHADKKILFTRIYSCINDSIDEQIGIFEFKPSDNIEDNDGDIDLEKINEPLLYSFVTKKYLKARFPEELEEDENETKYENEEKNIYDDDEVDLSDDEVNEVEEDEEENEEEKPDELFDDDKNVFKQLENADEHIEEGQSLTQDQKERDLYVNEAHNTWVEKFLHNNNYDIQNVESNGDCLFAVIREGLKGINKEVTVEMLRKMLADNVQEEKFQEYKQFYTEFIDEIKKQTTLINNIKKEYKLLGQQITSEKDRDTQKQLASKGKKLKKKFQQENNSLKITKELLGEYQFMKNINNLVEFKTILQSCTFWADAWAIDLLEKIINLKLIIFNSTNYTESDRDNVLQCQIASKEIEENKTEFNPKYYILADYTGNHYKLITYKNKRIFTFKDIPYSIKNLVKTKCMESRGNTIYNFIPAFKDMLGDNVEENIIEKDGSSICEVQNEPKEKSYNDEIVFQFYSKSKDAMPGRGAGEKMPIGQEKSFAELNQIKDWRKQLSNFWVAEFDADGKKWNSVEHYYQGSKFKNSHPVFYSKFSLSHEDHEEEPQWIKQLPKELSKDPVIAQRLGGKSGIYKKIRYRPKEIRMDDDFLINKFKVMEKGQYAKYSQNDDLKNMLLLTKDAKLQHFIRGCKPVVFQDTIKLRKQFNST